MKVSAYIFIKTSRSTHIQCDTISRTNKKYFATVEIESKHVMVAF